MKGGMEMTRWHDPTAHGGRLRKEERSTWSRQLVVSLGKRGRDGLSPSAAWGGLLKKPDEGFGLDRRHFGSGHHMRWRFAFSQFHPEVHGPSVRQMFGTVVTSAWQKVGQELVVL